MTTTVTTKLEAINVMLTAIGESPVNTITSSTTTDVSIAIQILDNVSREVQSVGWHFNTDTNYLLAKNSSDQIVLPTNCLRVDNSNKDADLDLVERGRKLWDRENHTYTITKDIRVNITWFLEFTELPETARRYITIRAARIFQDRMLASETLHAFHQVDELSALSALKEHEGDTRDHSIFDNYSTYRVIDRDNFQPAKTTISDE
jgi:hypothetical protein|tara:strand:+ start:858 stop:1472 length:615 start_codon:yes stop_codon:yes gene_type:complete